MSRPSDVGDDDVEGGNFPVNDEFHCVIFIIVSSAELNTAFSHTPVTELSFSNYHHQKSDRGLCCTVQSFGISLTHPSLVEAL